MPGDLPKAAVILFTASFGSALAMTDNLIRNGGFEEGVSLNWRQSIGRATEEREIVRKSGTSMKLTADAQHRIGLRMTGLGLLPGRYEISAHVFIPTDQGKGVSAGLWLWQKHPNERLLTVEASDKGKWMELKQGYEHKQRGIITLVLRVMADKDAESEALCYWDDIAVRPLDGGGAYLPVTELPVYRDEHNKVAEGMKVRGVGGYDVEVEAGTCFIGGKAVSRAKPDRLKVSPGEVVRVPDAHYVLSGEPPHKWRSKTKLKDNSGEPLRPGVLTPGSVCVKSAPGDGGVIFEAGRDYILDEMWAALSRKPEGRIGKGQPVHIDYRYGLSRLDTVVIDRSGEVSVRKGENRAICPEPPALREGELVLANIYLAPNIEAVEDENLYVIVVGRPEVPGAREAGKKVPRTKERLRSGKEVRIVFWGNSVTVGGDASVPLTRFADSFTVALGKQFPQAVIRVHNAGIGGSNTRQRLPDIQSEVLAHKPHLVIIEFVNDMGFPVELIHQNYSEAIGKIRGTGGEVVILTPHFTMPRMMGFKSLKEQDKRAACQALREVAEREGVALADAARLWETLYLRGIPYMTLLKNGINHPDDRGHHLFVDALMTLFAHKK